MQEEEEVGRDVRAEKWSQERDSLFGRGKC